MSIAEQLVAEGLIEAVPVDLAGGELWLADAARHLESAQKIADLDPAGAYALAYDAARKGVAAILLSRGYRVRGVPGSHRALARFAVSLATNSAEGVHLGRLDTMRRNRNRSEYGARVFGSAEVAADLAHARAILVIARREAH